VINHAAAIHYMFGGQVSVPLVIREEVIGGRADHEWAGDRRIREVLNGTIGGVAISRFPRGLDTVIGADGRGVSGGERARLGLARGLVSARPVLLLDEPVAHLDHATADAVLGDLTRSATGRSVIMVSHRPDGLERFDTVIDLSQPGSTPRD